MRGVRFAYVPDEPILRGLDLTVEPGENVFLLGASGSGKSTLLRCIAGLETGYEGTIECDGRRLDPLPPHRRGVGMLFQEPPLFPHLKVWQNVAFGLKYRQLPRRDQRAEAERWLALVDLGHKADAHVDELSGGERQRVALARTLAAEPRVVLLDEPLSSLDTELRLSLGRRIKALLADQGVAALWVTHDRDEAVRLGDRVFEMVEGRVRPAQTSA